MRACVLSRLDYCNALLSNVGVVQMDRLQRVQNAAARIISLKKKDKHISPTLDSLHWLRVKKRVMFKILTLTYKCLQNIAPGYLGELIPLYRPARRLRSSTSTSLVSPHIRRKIGEGAFSSIAPHLWNELPQHLKTCKSIDVFKKHLKTDLCSE